MQLGDGDATRAGVSNQITGAVNAPVIQTEVGDRPLSGRGGVTGEAQLLRGARQPTKKVDMEPSRSRWCSPLVVVQGQEEDGVVLEVLAPVDGQQRAGIG
ncbi:hypothetical protein [Actinokineospora sp. NBRC 105648]|uniref:hypothetical protein n=1 Tax=Actinokineospora sp. NBRC 105648 TaxID=3032206 RepID=UPI0025572404|nr:hypothetical protein [Actinokineospora sp. NBRC 105648]